MKEASMDTVVTDTPSSAVVVPDRHAHIKGWGADLDHANRPAYPMERTPPRLKNVHWHEPEQQPVTTRVFHSTERPGITPVFGTTLPPRGLSGAMRAWAFKYSENNIFHWLLLMFADRVNVVEGVGDDLRSGHVPNIFSEMGGRAELKHNAAGFARKVIVTSAIAGIAIMLVNNRRRRQE
jgi:hypothetical protein